MKNKLLNTYLIFGFFLVKLTLAPLTAQTNNDYMDLLLLYVDEKYDVCYNKSLKYTEKEKTKKDPLPFLYVSMSSLEMSRDHKYTNSHPKAYKTAISFAAKYRKKDKEYKHKSDAAEFIDKFKLIILEEIENVKKEGISQEHLKKVQKKALSDFAFGLRSPSRLADLLSYYQIMTGDYRTLFRTYEQLETIQVSQIQEAARQYLKPEWTMKARLIPKK